MSFTYDKSSYSFFLSPFHQDIVLSDKMSCKIFLVICLNKTIIFSEITIMEMIK